MRIIMPALIALTRSSGDPQIDAYAVQKIAPSMVYQSTEALTCKPLTVEYRVTGEQAS